MATSKQEKTENERQTCQQSNVLQQPEFTAKHKQPSTVRRGRPTFVHWAIDTVAAVIVAPIFVVVAPTWSIVTVVPIGSQCARVLCVAKGILASSFNGVGDTVVVTNEGIARGLRKKWKTSESWSCDGVFQQQQ